MKLNITSKLLSLFAVAALTFTACGDKDDDAQPNAGEAACKMTGFDFSEDETNTIEYNSKGLISKVNYTYTDGEDEFTGYTVFIYDSSDKLVREEEYEDGTLDEYKVYTYSNGLLSKREEFDANDVLDYAELFKYDANKRVIEIAENYENGENYKVNFTYNNQGNISQALWYIDGDLEYTDTYSDYDNKNTPFSAVKGFVEPWFGSSKNNPGKITTTYEFEGEEFSSDILYEYSYNDKGFPTQVFESSEWGDHTTTYTYQCN